MKFRVSRYPQEISWVAAHKEKQGRRSNNSPSSDETAIPAVHNNPRGKKRKQGEHVAFRNHKKCKVLRKGKWVVINPDQYNPLARKVQEKDHQHFLPSESSVVTRFAPNTVVNIDKIPPPSTPTINTVTSFLRPLHPPPNI